jgi:1,4-alpha-glucan branching enzyme
MTMPKTTGSKSTRAPAKRGARPKSPKRQAPPAGGPPSGVPPEGSLLTELDLYLFNEGTHYRLHDKLGSHPMTAFGQEGTYFAVWAPSAERVSVIGEFDDWDKDSNPLSPRGGSGIWERFLPGVRPGTKYKYHIVSRHNGYRVDKTDPFSVHCEVPPRTASIVWHPEHAWQDAAWRKERGGRQSLEAPMAVYEVHLGSWMRVPEENGRMMTYRELAPRLAEYVEHMGFTHVEFLPVMEHPFYGSWGYQTTGYFAPTSRYGPPEDFMALIDLLHQKGIGVILDWVPSHFPTDEHGLGYFDGTHLFEHADPRKGFHPDWNSLIFNYGRNEVRSFLLSSAIYWLDHFHVDALRVDAVASMLYLDYSRREGEWIPNEHGGRENLEAISFLRRFNEALFEAHPDAQTIAEESTAWPMVSRPTYVGGLGFGMKWDMGWMHDTLAYMSHDPVHRKYHHNNLTFRMLYAFTENFVLPLSHDEVVYGKGSLLGKMPGDDWQKFANLRLLFGCMYTQPGKKLLFMGGEIAQWSEWAHDSSIDWHLLEYATHAGVQRWVRDLNTFYRGEPCLHQLDCSPAGFQWLDCSDTEQSTISFVRQSRSPDEAVIAVLNFTPVPRHNYRLGVPWGGYWAESLNSDAQIYGGGGQGNMGGLRATPVSWHGRTHSLNVTLPPLGIVIFRSTRQQT